MAFFGKGMYISYIEVSKFLCMIHAYRIHSIKSYWNVYVEQVIILMITVLWDVTLLDVIRCLCL
jgi:hypothetical protein